MGTDLYAIGNHTLRFKNLKTQLARVIKILNDLDLDRDWLIDLRKTHLERSGIEVSQLEECPDLDWKTNEYCEENFEAYKTVEIEEANYGFHIIVYVNMVDIGTPYRYWVLESLEKPEVMEHFRKWRNYFFEIVRALGGDRIAYLADNSHPLGHFLDIEEKENYTFDELEKDMERQFGPPCESIFTLKHHIQGALYFVDKGEELK